LLASGRARCLTGRLANRRRDGFGRPGWRAAWPTALTVAALIRAQSRDRQRAVLPRREDSHPYSVVRRRRRMKSRLPAIPPPRRPRYESRPWILRLLSLEPPGRRSGRAQRFSTIGIRSRMSRVTTGPTVTTNSDGRMQKKIGNTSLTAIFAARSSARWRAITRM